MAKTKGSNPPETEYAYTDADGVLHYFGEFYRMIFGEGSISPRDPETDITGQTRRGERPSQQGEGTETQKFYRKAFKDCTMLWNSLPEECPDPVGDPPETSKKSVWDAKLKFGVVCSYYDLFLRCCINWAKWHAGEMPNGDCFPCIAPCDCTDISIGYTTQGMQVNEQQTLSVVGAIEDCIYNWEITAGGGALSNAQGASTIYTAPATNAECANNPTIELRCGGDLMASLKIAVNAAGAEYPAYTKNKCVTEWSCTPGASEMCAKVVCERYTCDGTNRNDPLGYCGGGGISGGIVDCTFCADLFRTSCEDASNLSACYYNGISMVLGTSVDTRTEALKNMGCCPAALL